MIQIQFKKVNKVKINKQKIPLFTFLSNLSVIYNLNLYIANQFLILFKTLFISFLNVS
jgi:hypothetical protein